MATRPKSVISKQKKQTNTAIETNYCTMQLSQKCSDANGILPFNEFYTSCDTAFYKNGKFNICKNCIKEYVYGRDKEVDLNRFKVILRIFNLPLLKKEWETSVENKNETIGSYMKNIFFNHKDKAWLDGDVLDSATDNKVIANEIEDEELSDRWGFGFTRSELSWLEKNYVQWCTHHEVDKLSVQRLVMMICVKELEIRKARESGKATDKLEKALMELMNSSNLTPRTMSAINETNSSKIFGLWIKDIEQNRPSEYFKDKSIYEDYDNVQSYFERFILRPMRNLLTGSRDFDKEFQSIEFEDMDSGLVEEIDDIDDIDIGGDNNG